MSGVSSIDVFHSVRTRLSLSKTQKLFRTSTLLSQGYITRNALLKLRHCKGMSSDVRREDGADEIRKGSGHFNI